MILGYLSRSNEHVKRSPFFTVITRAHVAYRRSRRVDFCLTHKDGSVTPVTISDYDWAYDAASRITSFDSSQDGTVDYTYDAAGQVTKADFDYMANPDETYTYDKNGNRTITGYTTGDNNQLTADGTFTYLYDDEGNRTKRTRISSAQVADYTVEYKWDHRNRLTTITFKNNAGTVKKEIDYKYDAFDRRIAKLLDSDGNGTVDSEEHYVYDGADIVLQYDDASSLTHRYLHGPAIDQVLADEDDLGDVLWPLADNQGTVRDLVDDNGDVQNHLTFDAFGKITSESDDTVDHLYAYTGREWDADAELYYYRARWYDPAVGRFVSEDPIGLGPDANLSRYVGNSPSNATDLSGLHPIDNNLDKWKEWKLASALTANYVRPHMTWVFGNKYSWEYKGKAAAAVACNADVQKALKQFYKEWIANQELVYKGASGHARYQWNGTAKVKIESGPLAPIIGQGYIHGEGFVDVTWTPGNKSYTFTGTWLWKDSIDWRAWNQLAPYSQLWEEQGLGAVLGKGFEGCANIVGDGLFNLEFDVSFEFWDTTTISYLGIQLPKQAPKPGGGGFNPIFGDFPIPY